MSGSREFRLARPALPAACRRIAAPLVAAICAAAPVLANAAAPDVKYLYPAGAARGTSVEVTAGGNVGEGSAQAWVNRPGLTVAAAEKGKFTIAAAPEAVPGTYWIRIYNAEGANAPVPFVVGTLPECMEQEPNDAPAKAQAMAGSTCTVNGRLEKRGDVDCFAVSLRQGQTLVAAVSAHETLGSPMDAVLQIVSPRSSVLAQNDDERGLDPLVAFTAPADGVYLARIFAFPASPDASISFAGGETFIYRLTLTTGGFVDGSLPLAVSRAGATEVEAHGWNIAESAARCTIEPLPDAPAAELFSPQWSGTITLPQTSDPSLVEHEPNDAAQPQAIALPAVVSGRIGQRDDRDAFRLTLAKGQAWQFRLESQRLGYPLDAVLELFDSSGKSLARADDSGKQRDAELTFTAAADGDYTLVISDLYGHGGPRYFYRLSMAPSEPDFSLSVAQHAYVLKAGAPLEIPVTLDRRQNFSGEIELHVRGLPEGVTAAPLKSIAKSDTEKSAKLVLIATPAEFSGVILIEGIATAPASRSHFATSPLPAGAVTSDLWLTVISSEK